MKCVGCAMKGTATMVGVLVEVPVMLSVCAACNRTRHWFPASASLPLSAGEKQAP
jgi:ACR3 family arsenite efflux pump ArsB